MPCLFKEELIRCFNVAGRTTASEIIKPIKEYFSEKERRETVSNCEQMGYEHHWLSPWCSCKNKKRSA